MRYVALCILLLAICEPYLVHAKKVVLVFPRQIRRSPALPWRPGSPNLKKSAYGHGEHQHHVYQTAPTQTYYLSRKPPFNRGPNVPHGGDDFDQGHEEVSHVNIPYGKGVSHAISFGKGYIPYDNIKNAVPYSQRYTDSFPHKNKEPEFAPSNYPPGVPHYASIPPSYLRQTDPYLGDTTAGSNLHEPKLESKYYSSRSIDKEVGSKGQISQNSAIEPIPKGTDFNLNLLPHSQEGAIVLPSGIPPATIGGSKEGIVLRDSVFLDDYQKKVEEFTKTWPGAFSASAGVRDHDFSQQQYGVTRFPTAGLPGSSFPGANGWLSEFAQSKQGYAVKEDISEPPHDFRTMPVQTSPVQPLPIPVSFGSSLSSISHGKK